MTPLDNADLQSLKKFVVVMYNRSSADKSVNDARLNLFACKQRLYDAIPPVCPQATFKACCLPKRNCLRSSHSLSTWWSRQGDTWKIHKTDIPSVAASCQELTKCGYRKDCCGRCKCLRSVQRCVAVRAKSSSTCSLTIVHVECKLYGSTISHCYDIKSLFEKLFLN